jgi:hypothetical protein
MIVNVEQKHIDAGLAGECDMCPVALALIGAGCYMVTVGNYEMNFIYKDESYYLDNPNEVVLFIDNFDDENPVVPFSFRLEI